MKVLYFCNYFQPMNYGENEISTALANLGHEVTIVTGDKYFPFPNYDDTIGKLLGKRQQKLGSSKIGEVKVVRNKIVSEFAARALFFGVKECIEKIQPDIMLVSGISTPVSFQAALFKPANCRLIIIDSHLPSELNQGNKTFKYLFYLTFRILFAPAISVQADKVIAVQEATAEIIKNTYGIRKPAVVISHGTDKDTFVFSEKSREELRKKLSIPFDDFIVVTTGKIIPAKGVDLLFKAVALLLEKHSSIHLLVVGDGPKDYKENCLSFFSKKHLKNLHMEGFQPQSTLPGYYSASDVAVWPLQESLAMNDAISCSLPLIVNDKIGVKERFSNQNGEFYVQGDVKDLAEKIEDLFLHPKKRKEMGERGRELVEKRMSWAQKAKEYIE